MRPYEAALHLLVALKNSGSLGFGWDLLLTLGLVFALYNHLRIEKSTWRSYVLYAVIFLNILLLGIQMVLPQLQMSPFIPLALFTLTVISGLIHWIYQIPTLPKLTQPIGTKLLSWSTEVQFNNISGERVTQPREIKARLWYPAETIEGYTKRSYYGPADYSPHAGWFYDNIRHFALTRVNARYDAPLSNSRPRYPVIIFTHGQESVPENHTAVLERLASRGFVVLGLYHNDLNGKYPGPLSFRLMELAATVHKIVALNAEPGFFHERLLLTHGVGLHGHSLGGATSFFASTNFESLAQRYLSALPVPLACCSCSDPWMWIVIKENYDVVRPLLLIKSDHWLGREDDLDKIHHFATKRLRAPVAVVTMHNTWHFNFGDMVFKLWSPLGLKVFPRSWRCEGNLVTPMLGESGQRAVRTLNDVMQFVEEFHTHHLVEGSRAPYQPSPALMDSSTCSVALNLPK